MSSASRSPVLSHSSFEEDLSQTEALTDQEWTTLDHTVEQSKASEDEKGDEVCVALPPNLFAERSVNEVALTGSAALDVLDQLLANNGIGKERAARLRRKYNELRDNLETYDSECVLDVLQAAFSRSRQLENTLLLEAKSLEAQLAQQRRVLERGANFPDGDNSESGRLRQNLLTHQNELDQTEEKIEKLDKEIAQLEKELAGVEKEYSRQPKKGELEQHIRDLVRQRDDFKIEIDKRNEDIKRLKEDLDKKNFKTSVIRVETDDLLCVLELLQGELIEIRNRPSIPREIDNIKTQQREVNEKIEYERECLREMEPQVSERETSISALKTEHTELCKKLKESEKLLESEQIHLERLNKDLDTAKEREASLHEDRASLELRWKHRCQEHKSLHESLSSKNKEKDKELKSLKKAELQLGIVKEHTEQAARKQKIVENKCVEQKGWCEAIDSKREEVDREVELLRKSLLLAMGASDEQTTMVVQLHIAEQRLKAEIKRQMSILQDLSKNQVSMKKSRDQDAKEFYKIRREQRAIFNELRSKEGEIEDHRKRITELQIQLKDFAGAYEVVKTERNKIHSHIQLLQQVGAELAEKSKVLQNETEILRTTTVTKERLLQKCALVTTAKVMERDTQRQDVGKLKQSQSELNSELEVSREAISKLTQQINTAEHQLSRLRRHYEQSVQDRNDLGLQLIERNEEVCVFYEKMNIQESQIRNANMELSAREEEIKFLDMELSRLQSDIVVWRKSLPVKDKVEMDLVNAQIQLKSCQERLQQLEQAVECASDPTRIRLLGGDNPSRKELNEKIDALETKLSQCEQQLLEKELLFEQVSKLTDRASKRVDGQRESTLSVAKKVNSYQTKIKEANRKMMALVSELSMTQAKTLGLQQESREAELRLETAYTRMANGEPPDNETKGEWDKMVRQKEQRKADKLARRKLQDEEDSRILPGGAVTHADPRPNAYMPLGEDELPIPKPYGTHAPFKPSQPGANLRHIRKPELKPIDI